MFFRRRFKYIFLIVPLVIMYRPLLFFGNQYSDASVGSIFLSNMFGGSYAVSKIKITLSVMSLFSIIIINILLSDYISGDLLNNGEYIFCRVKNRRKWFIKKCFGLMGYSFAGVCLTVSLYSIGAVLKSNKNIMYSDVSVIFQTVLILFLFTVMSSNLINIFSLRYGISISFLIVYSIIVVSTILIYIFQKYENIKAFGIMQRMNIMSNVIIAWNFSDKYIWYSMTYFLVLNLIIIFAGVSIVQNYEIGIKNKEQ